MPSSKEEKERRVAAIRTLLKRHRVGSQGELADRLSDLGFGVTQSSVSRDLKELGAEKEDGRYVLPEAPAAEENLGVLARNVQGTEPAGDCLLVVRTRLGSAPLVGVALDRMGWPELVGTIAGDDTVFLAARGKREQRTLQRRLTTLIAKENRG